MKERRKRGDMPGHRTGGAACLNAQHFKAVWCHIPTAQAEPSMFMRVCAVYSLNVDIISSGSLHRQ